MKNRDEVLLEIEQVFGKSSPEDLVEGWTRWESYWTYDIDNYWYLKYTDCWHLHYEGVEFRGDTLRGGGGSIS